MIILSTEDFVKKLLAQAKDEAWEDFKDDCEYAIKFYEDDQLYLMVEEEGGSYYARVTGEPQRHWDTRKRFICTLNITRMIVDKLAGGLYDSTPTRTVEMLDANGKPIEDSGNKPFEILRKTWTENNFTAKMADLNRWKVLLGTGYAYPQWSQEDSTLDIQFLTPDLVRLAQDIYNPQYVGGYRFDCTVSQDTGTNDIYTKIWTADTWIDLLNDREEGRGPNPYPFMPPVMVRYKDPWYASEVRGVGIYQELIPANDTINKKLSRINFVAGTQMGGVPVFTNVAPGDVDNKYSPLVPIVLPQRDDKVPSFQFVQGTPLIEAGLEDARSYLSAVFNSFGLYNSQPLNINLSNPESGVAKWIQEAEIRGRQRSQLPKMLDFERAVAERILVMNATHIISPAAGKAMYQQIQDGKIRISIDYGDEQPPMTIDEDIAQENQELSLNLTNPIELMRKRNPDLRELKDDEVIELIAQNQITKDKIEKRYQELRTKEGLTPEVRTGAERAPNMFLKPSEQKAKQAAQEEEETEEETVE